MTDFDNVFHIVVGEESQDKVTCFWLVRVSKYDVIVIQIISMFACGLLSISEMTMGTAIL